MKIEYDGIKFDSELEVEYYKELTNLLLKGVVVDFTYHPIQITNLVGKRSYTPDFLVLYTDHIEIVETKGFNPYSKMIDDQIHNVMLTKNEAWLGNYVLENLRQNVVRFEPYVNAWEIQVINRKVEYKKIKHLKAYGFVDWDFKNPNTIANQRKEKINNLSVELKESNKKIKDYERYINYSLADKKLTKTQREWKQNFEALWRLSR